MLPTFKDKLRPYAPLLAVLLSWLVARFGWNLTGEQQSAIVDQTVDIVAMMLALYVPIKVQVNKRANPLNADSATFAAEGKEQHTERKQEQRIEKMRGRGRGRG